MTKTDMTKKEIKERKERIESERRNSDIIRYMTISLTIIFGICLIFYYVYDKYLPEEQKSKYELFMNIFIPIVVIISIYLIFLAVAYIIAVINLFINGPVMHRKSQKVKVYNGDKTCTLQLSSRFDNKNTMADNLANELESCNLYVKTKRFTSDTKKDKDLEYHLKSVSGGQMKIYGKNQFTIEFESEKLAKEYGFESKSITSKLKSVVINSKKETKQYHFIEQTLSYRMNKMGLFPQGDGWFLNPSQYYLENKSVLQRRKN